MKEGSDWIDIAEKLGKHQKVERMEESEKAEELHRTQSYTSADWSGVYMEQKSEMRLVAEIGQRLLEKSTRDDSTIERLQREMEEVSLKLEHSENSNRKLKDERRNLERQMKSAEDLNNSIMSELEHKQEEGRLKLVEHRVNAFLVEQNKQLQDDLEVCKLELYKRNQDFDQAKFKIRKLKQQKSDLQRDISRTNQLAQSDSNYAQSQGLSVELLRVTEELQNFRGKFSELEENFHVRGRDLEDLEEEKRILQKEVERQLKNNQDLVQKLNIKSVQISELHQKVEEMQLVVSTSGENLNGPKGSIFSELEDQIAREKQRISSRLLRADSIRQIKKISSREEATLVDEKKKEKSSVTESNSLYMNLATKEYFYLTCSAVKVNIAYKKRPENVFKIDCDELFAQASTQRIPFHEWHSWLHQQLDARTSPAPEPEIRPKLQHTATKTNIRNSETAVPVKESRMRTLLRMKSSS